MRKTIKVLVAAAAALLMVSTAAHASHQETGSYTLATTPGVSAVCSPDCLGNPDLNYGGFQFAPNGEVPVRADFADVSGGNVSYTVAQDLNGDGLAGDTGEPSVSGCGKSADLTTSTVAFKGNRVTSVFIVMLDPLFGGCADSLATSGTITLTYA